MTEEIVSGQQGVGTGESILHPEEAIDPFRALMYAENRKPEPTDQFFIGSIQSGTIEYDELHKIGISEEELSKGRFTRQQLVDAGFFFINRIGGGEKPLLSGDFPDPNNPGQMLNYGNRLLLTREELETVYAYQCSRPDIFGLRGEDVNDVRSDLLMFAARASWRPPFDNYIDLAQQAIPYKTSVPGSELEPEDWQLLDRYWDYLAKEYNRQHPDDPDTNFRAKARAEFIRTHCADLANWVSNPDGKEIDMFNNQTTRGCRTQSVGSRSAKVRDNPSPFLDSGFVFDYNFDASVFEEGPADVRSNRQYRINTVIVHLMGHPDFPGLSEMGGVQDQVYMPTGIFVSRYYLRDPAEREKVRQEVVQLLSVKPEDVIKMVQHRALEAARQWAETQAQSRGLRIARLFSAFRRRR